MLTNPSQGIPDFVCTGRTPTLTFIWECTIRGDKPNSLWAAHVNIKLCVFVCVCLCGREGGIRGQGNYMYWQNPNITQCCVRECGMAKWALAASQLPSFVITSNYMTEVVCDLYSYSIYASIHHQPAPTIT